MTEEPLVSVIVPVYNVEQYLPKCIESISSQTYKNLEILLIDDGSTDSSGKICDDVAKENKAIKVLHTQNRGISSTRNLGIKHSSADYICFIDSDDYVLKDYVSYLKDLLFNSNADMAISAHTIRYASGKSIYKGIGESETKSFDSRQVLKEILIDRILDISVWGKLYKKSLFNEVKFPDGEKFEEPATMYKVIENTNKIICGGKSNYIYQIRPQSITTEGTFYGKLELITHTKKMCADITEKFPSLKNAAERRLIWAYFSTLNQLEKCPDKKNYQTEEKEIVSYILENKKTILHGREYSKRDKIAALTLSMGLPVYNLLWKLYSRISKQ